MPIFAILQGFLLRGSLIYAVGNVLVLAVSIQGERRTRPLGWVPIIAAAIGMLFLTVGSFGLGAAIASWIAADVWPGTDAVRWCAVFGGLTGLYAGRIVLQLLQNGARRFQGLPVRKIEWWQAPKRNRRRPRKPAD